MRISGEPEHIADTSRWSVPQRHCDCRASRRTGATVHVCGCTGTTVSRPTMLTNFTYTHAPAARR